MAGSGGGDNGTLSYLVAARGCCLLAEDHLGEKNYPRDITHKVVVNIWLQLRRDLSKKCVKLLEQEVTRTPTISWLP